MAYRHSFLGLPKFLATIMKLCSYINNSPRFYMSVINAVMICFSLLPVYITFQLTRKIHNKEKAIIAAALPAFWFTLTIVSYTTLNGNLPAYLFALNCYLIINHLENQEKNNKNNKLLIVIGSIFGLITILRFHLLPEIAFAMIYCCRKNFIFNSKLIIFGFAITLLPLGLLDWFTWGYPFQSIIKNFYMSIFQGVAEKFGTEPFYYYILIILKSWNILFIPLCYFAYLGFKKHPIFIWVALIDLLSFSLISHKEIRFILLFIVCFFISSGIGVAEFYNLIINKPNQSKTTNKNYKQNLILKLTNISKEKFIYLYVFFLAILILFSCGLTAYLRYYYRNQSIMFSMKINDLVSSKLNYNISKIFQFKSKKDTWCGGGYSYLNLNIPYAYENCIGTKEYEFFSKNQSNLSKTKMIITPKEKIMLGGQMIYCDRSFCAYSYPYKITETKYYLWKTLPFYI